MNNSVYGKEQFLLVTNEKSYTKYIIKPNFESAVRFSEQLVKINQ